MTCFVCKELTLKVFEGNNCQIYQTVKTVQQKLSRFYQFREWTVFSISPTFMSNVVCSEYCSESVVTCFVCKELTLKEFEGIVGDPEGYVNSSAESVVTCFVCKELTLKEFEGIVGDPEGYVNSSAESVLTCFVCKELTLKEFEGIVFDPEGYVNSSAESVVTCFVCKELTLKKIEGNNC